MSGERSNCRLCIHLRERMLGKYTYTCDAFPGGIPPSILRGEFDHNHAYMGDRGIRYENRFESERRVTT